MNANLLPQTPTIKDWLSSAFSQLSKIGIDSARLDSEIILAYILGRNRTYLHAHADEMVDKQIAIKANAQLKRRLNHTPIAYIIGYKEFYDREFIVTPATLIPRPESEDIIDVLKKILTSTPISRFPTPNTQLVDVGTGSGCLGITAKLEFPFLDVTLTDISERALLIAKQNAKKYKINVNYFKGDLLKNYQKKPDIIIANLPYVDSSWKRSLETDFEPSLALFASNRGLSVIKRLIVQASKKLKSGSYLILEADPIQHDELIELAKKLSFKTELRKNYVIAFVKKVSG